MTKVDNKSQSIEMWLYGKLLKVSLATKCKMKKSRLRMERKVRCDSLLTSVDRNEHLLDVWMA